MSPESSDKESTDNGPVKLVLCFDGTGNSFTGTDQDTNVVKLLSKLDRNRPNQYHYYQTGIGTYEANESVNKSIFGEIKSNVSKALDEGFANTFEHHVMAGYRFLMRYYEDGAKIYMFGFSRGAFTAKFLAQMIHTVGLLCKGNEEMVPFAFRLYQDYLKLRTKQRKNRLKEQGKEAIKQLFVDIEESGKIADEFSDAESDSEDEEECHSPISHGDADTGYGSASGEDEETSPLLMDGHHHYKEEQKCEIEIALEKIRAFSRTFCRKDSTAEKSKFIAKNIKVHFLGIWDCVNSVALLETSASVPMPIFGTAKHVRHAVAIDERRVKFRPSLLSQDIAAIHRQRNKESANGQNEGAPSSPISEMSEAAQTKLKEEAVAEEDVKEVWFPGSHCDVGGGWLAENPIEKSLLQPKAKNITWWNKLSYFRKSFFQSKDPKNITFWNKLSYFWSGSQTTQRPNMKPVASEKKPSRKNSVRRLDGKRKNKKITEEPIQMSDVALKWMIDELKDVESREIDCSRRLYWNKNRLRNFKKSYYNWKSKALDQDNKDPFKLGFLHDPLKFRSGTGFWMVLMWMSMELMPFIMPRWELVDNKWISYRFRPSVFGTRDIPEHAVLHESVSWRLQNDPTYRPTNDHGDFNTCSEQHCNKTHHCSKGHCLDAEDELCNKKPCHNQPIVKDDNLCHHGWSTDKHRILRFGKLRAAAHENGGVQV